MMRRTPALLVLLLPLLSAHLVAQQPIRALADQKEWILTTGEMSYVIGINDHQELQTIYWGARLPGTATPPVAKSSPELASFDPSITTTPNEYAAWGGGLTTEPALKASMPNGNRALTLIYESAKIDGPQLEITLVDKLASVKVHLFYRTYAESGVLARWSRIENQGKSPLTIESASSATWNLPAGKDYRRYWLTGRWGGEWQLHDSPVQNGTAVLESRRGSTSHQVNPWFMVDRAAETTEESGPAWFGELAWSGSWRMVFDDTALDQLRITGGYNPFDFSYPLATGESLTTPLFYAGYTAHGKGEASRILHRFQRSAILPHAPEPKLRPVLYNSWEATEFSVDEPGQIALAERAAKLGVERFTIDDGWFGQRKDDHAGLGDWYINKQKFPNGLKPVIDKVHALGMDFGLWVEPEMINPDSDLYRKHPDWAMNFPGRPRTEARNQLLLNLARPDVKEYTFHWLDELVSNNDIAFLKWDYNRNWSEPGWDAVDLPHQKEIYIKYIENLYDIFDRLRKKHPRLEIESCSGGGGRVDLGILKYTEEVWPSDNTDALDRLTMQDGFSHAYTPNVMVAWVTDVPNGINGRITPLKFRFLVAMTGSLGVGVNLNKWTPEEMALGTRMISLYKDIRPIVQTGDLYRLRAPQQNDGSAIEYLSQDKQRAVVFAFLHSQNFGTPYPILHLQGLDPNATYRIAPLDPDKAPKQTQATGAELMNGLQLRLRGDYDSTELTLEKISAP